PKWATSDGLVLVAQAIWVVESGGRTIAVDPCGASDAFLRTGPAAAAHEQAVRAAMAAAGVPVGSVDMVVMSHLDGIGMVAAIGDGGSWLPLFPNARVVISAEEVSHVETHPDISGSQALRELIAQDVVDAVDLPLALAPR
ncbi:MAG: hypothetical protein ACLQPH_07405, partial [Acidimicrobiales bacterium]